MSNEVETTRESLIKQALEWLQSHDYDKFNPEEEFYAGLIADFIIWRKMEER